MSDRLADIRIPPACRELIRDGALVSVSTSGGKDSQTMAVLLSRIVPRDRLVAVCAAGRSRIAEYGRVHTGNAPARHAPDPRASRFRQDPARQHRGTGPVSFPESPLVYELA